MPIALSRDEAKALGMPALVVVQIAICATILAYATMTAWGDAARLLELRQREQEADQLVDRAAAQKPPRAVQAARPLLKLRRANARALLGEQLNALLGEQGMTVQSVTLDRSRAFGRGMTAYWISISGKADAAGLSSALRWLAANRNSVAVQRVVAQPLQEGARPELSEVGLQLIVLAGDA